MPIFVYTALSTSGSELSGKQQSTDLSSAAQSLRERGLRVIELKQIKGKGGFLGQANFSDWLASQTSVSPSALVFFFRQMAFMLRAGLPVMQALELSNKQVSSSRLKLTIRLMLKDIESGQALSLAMKKHKDVFPNMAVNLIVAGESTGDLDAIMERLAIHLEKKAALRAHMINAMIYPSVVFVAAIVVGAFMTLNIIPKFADFILAQGRPLPNSTQALIDFSIYVENNGLKIIATVISFIMVILLTYQTKRGRYFIDSLLLRIPIMGSMITTGSMAQMTWALSTLLRSGVTVYQALKITAELINNRVFADKLIHASSLILNGKDMSSSIEHKQMPVLLIQMIAVGEKTGSLDHILMELGVYYEQLLETAIKRLSAMIEPAMILLIGGMVGFVYYAFFQALFSLVGG
ncbi:MAG: type II secretion protein F [Gammaproteobacteria bacterium]|nr:MAG: type II secretion protein F [Gammaproteobacteria bacterium]